MPASLFLGAKVKDLRKRRLNLEKNHDIHIKTKTFMVSREKGKTGAGKNLCFQEKKT